MDYIIKNGWIVNGKNEKPFYGDLAVKNGKIEEVGEHIEVPSDFSGKCVLDAAGGYVTPGFIDIHRHGDWQAFGNGDDVICNLFIHVDFHTVTHVEYLVHFVPRGSRLFLN